MCIATFKLKLGSNKIYKAKTHGYIAADIYSCTDNTCMKISFLCIYLRGGGEQFTSGGQGGFRHRRNCSEHTSSASHPPLSKSHDGSQYASPVGLYTSH